MNQIFENLNFKQFLGLKQLVAYSTKAKTAKVLDRV